MFRECNSDNFSLFLRHFPVGMWEFGATITVACLVTMLVHGAIEIKSWVSSSPAGVNNQSKRSVDSFCCFSPIADNSPRYVNGVELRIILLIRVSLQQFQSELERCSVTILGHSDVLIVSCTLANYFIYGSGVRPAQVRKSDK